MKRTFISFALSTFILLNAAHGQSEQLKPVLPGPEGQCAFDDLAKAYVNHSGLFDDKAALTDLNSPDAPTARRAGNYLLALFGQTLADESNGRTEEKIAPFFLEDQYNRALDFRKALATDFGQSVSSEAALPAALWLIENDPLADNTEAGIHVLARIHSDAANEALGQIIKEVHPNQEVLVTAIKEAGTRHLDADKAGIIALEQSYRKAVREAAVQSAAQLGETNPVPYDPLKAFSPRVLALLQVTLDRILTPVPADARWIDGIVQVKWVHPDVFYPIHGWLLSRDEKSPAFPTYLDVFGRILNISPYDVLVRLTPGSLEKAAKSYVELRATVATEAAQYHALVAKLLALKFNSPEWKVEEIKRGQLYPVTENQLREMSPELYYPWAPDERFLDLPEMTVAAWCWQRGDLADTAAVLFPCYNAARDDRELDWSSRDDLGTTYDVDLLQKFTVDRNYPAAITLATHLGKPAFAGYVYQARSRKLAAQLAARSEDFTTLTLPSPADWAKIKAPLDRSQQIIWLASRLKLMHTINPGYDEIQYAAAYPDDDAPKGAPEVINPYSELLQLNLTPADLLTLAPFATDQDYSLSYTFFEQQTPERGLCPVAWTVGDLINHVAGDTLVHCTENGIAFEHGTESTIVPDLQSWVAAHHDDTPDKLIAETLRTDADWNKLKEAAIQTLKLHHVELLDLLADRISSLQKVGNAQYEDSQLGDFVHLFYGSHAPMVDHARQWVKSPNPEIRLWASLILVRDGDVAHDEGFDTLEPFLNGRDALGRYTKVYAVLLASSTPRARRLAAGLFPLIHVHKYEANGFETDQMLKLYFVDGRKECLDFLLAAINDYTIDPNTFDDSGNPSYYSDGLIDQIGRWGFHDRQPPRTAEEKRRYRERLKVWLTAQFALIQQGKPSAVHTSATDEYEYYLFPPEPAPRHTAQEAAGTQD